MKNFKQVLKEINFELNKLVLFDAFLTTAIIFLLFYLFLSLANLPRTYSLVALIYLIIAAVIKLKERKTLDIELKFDFLKEKLRTAEDNINLQNPVVDELQQEIITDLKKVDEGAFVNEKRTYIKSAVIIFLCFLIIFVVPFSLPKLGFEAKAQKEAATEAFEEGNITATGTFAPEKEAREGLIPSPENIYGEESVAKLGNRELKVTIQPSGYELNIRDVSDIEDIDFVERYPEEVEATAASSYEENIPKEHAELVKKYFKALAEG